MQKKNSGKSDRKIQRKNKVLKVILLSSVFFAFLFFWIFVLFVHLVFAPAKTYSTETLTQEHIFHQSEVIKRLTALLWKSRPGKVCVLTLSPVEINALIAVISNSDSLGDFLLSASHVGETPKKRPYKITFRENRFDIKYSFPTEFYTPFGKSINLALSGKPALDKKGVQLDLKSVSAGDVSLPPQQTEKIIHALMSKYESNKTFKRIHDIIVKAYITPENNLVIYFYPYRIRNCLTEGF